MANRLTGGVDEFFARTDSSGATFPLADALGSTIALTDSSGAIQTQYAYEPFGATTPSGATSSNWYQFTGREDDGTGLYYYCTRYYSPRFQRFISQDPAGLAGGINFYAYAGNSPVNFKDPFGLKPNPCQSILCSPLFWQGVGIAALAVAAPEALPLEWAAEAEAAGEAAETAEAATAESEGLNDINILQEDFEHAIEGHTEGGSDTEGNSIFLGDAQDVANLIQTSQTDTGVLQPDTLNWAYVNYTGDAIGYTTTGQYTSVYTVIVDMFGNLVTAFPGFPLP